MLLRRSLAHLSDLVSKKASRRRFTRRLRLENLERRELLAGDVTASVHSGNLLISGDNLDNDIVITDTAPGTFQIAGNAGTTINGMAGPLVFPGVTGNVQVYLRDGNDAVTVDDVDVPGDLFISSTQGSDSITTEDSNIGGNLTVQSVPTSLGGTVDLSDLTVGGNLHLLTGNGSDDVLLDGLTVNGSALVSLNEGDDTLYINDDANGNSFGGHADIRLGDGNDVVRIDSISLGNTTFSGNLSIDLGEGDHTLNLFNEPFVVSGDFNLRAGDGNNITPGGSSINPIVAGDVNVVFCDGTNAVNYRGAVGGRFVYRAGSGNNDITLTETVASGGQTDYRVDIRTGGGDDTLALSGSTGANISGAVHLGGGTNTYDQGAPLWTINSPWMLTDGSSGSSRMVRFANGKLDVHLSPSETQTLTQTADNEFEVGSLGTYSGVNNILLTGSSGADDATVDLDDKTFTGNLTLNLRGGDDTISISSVVGGGVAGNVTVAPGGGNDITMLAGSIGGNLSLNNQQGDDTLMITGGPVNIGGSARITNVRDVMMTASGNSVGGSLTIQNIRAALGGTVSLGELVVGGNINLTTGDGPDDVLLDGLAVNGNLAVTLNDGDDTLFINDAAANNTFGGNANLRLGDGNDVFRVDSVILGNTTFARNLVVDLGEGDQTLNLLNEAFVVAGDFTLRAADGNNITPVTAAIAASVAGDVKFNLGDGDNSVDFSGAVGDRFVYRAGDGDNAITLNETIASGGQTSYQVDIQTGDGDDTLTLAGATGAAISGTVNLGGGTNAVDHGTPLWTINAPWTLTDGVVGASRKVRFSNGTLYVNLSPSETLTLTQTADNQFMVGPLGTYAGVGNIHLTGSSGADDVTVALADKTYTGNMTLNLGGGDDTVAISSALGAGTTGNVTVQPGSGNDVTTLTACVGGNFFLNNQQGDDTLTITGGSIEIGGNARITNVPNVTMTAGGNSVGGSLTIRNIQAALASGISLGGLTVGGNLSLTTGNGPDDVLLDGLTVNGRLLVTLNDGDDTLFIDHSATTNSFGGNAYLRLGDGNDVFRVDSATLGDTTFARILTVDLGEGDQTLNLLNEAFVVSGDFTLRAGDGNNVTPVANSISASVAGNVTFDFGDGNNSVDYGGAVGGRFKYRAGDGDNDITLTETIAVGGQTSYQVDIRTGSGDDTLTLAGTTGATIFGSVDLDGGTNAFDQGAPPWTIGSPWTLTI